MSENIHIAADPVSGDITIVVEGPQANKAVIRRYVEELLNRNDMAALPSIVAPDAVLESPMLDKPIQGLDGIRQFIEALHTGFPDLACQIKTIIGEGDEVAYYLHCEGTHKGTFAGVPATNKLVYWTVLKMVTLRDGEIVRLRTCDNLQKVLRAAAAT